MGKVYLISEWAKYEVYNRQRKTDYSNLMTSLLYYSYTARSKNKALINNEVLNYIINKLVSFCIMK